MKNPYTKAYIRRMSGTAEFSTFHKEFKKAVDEITATIPRFKPIKDYCNAYVMPQTDVAQFTVAKRKMGARDLEGKVTLEKGATLLYTVGPLGDVVCVLYPCQSDIAEVAETIIVLKAGELTHHQLRKRLRRDLRDLVAYYYVTSCEAEATPREWARVWWLRLMRNKTVKGEQVPALGKRVFGSAILFSWKTLISTVAMGLGRPLLFVAAVWLVTRYAPQFATWLTNGQFK